MEWRDRLPAAPKALRHCRHLLLRLALVNGFLLPGPKDAPIDKIFRTPGAAWLLFAFGVTFAPFFEEMVFRGFLLPALCTACDWIDEKITASARAPARSQTAIPVVVRRHGCRLDSHQPSLCR